MLHFLVDNEYRENFYPFSLTRSIVEVRLGIFSIIERWENYLGNKVGIYTVPYLQNLYPELEVIDKSDTILFINATCIPSKALILELNNLKRSEKLITSTGEWIATLTDFATFQNPAVNHLNTHIFNEVDFFSNAIDLLTKHATIIQSDFLICTKDRFSQHVDSSNNLICPENIFIEDGATISCTNLNASEGPIYIGKEAVIMEGVSIRGPFVLGHKGVVKMNTSIYGPSSVGPFCLMGGEVKNSIIMGYSNKGHEGYLGDSIIGYWCNLGAGTCNSNIKNTAGPIQMWNEGKQIWETIGQKMGMLVGDYTRFAIHSSINTGSYIGVCANIFGNGLLPKNIPNFTWGIKPGYRFEEIFEDINNWKKLKGIIISEEEKKVLTYLHKQSV